jgi:hypothetical protein
MFPNNFTHENEKKLLNYFVLLSKELLKIMDFVFIYLFYLIHKNIIIRMISARYYVTVLSYSKECV